jgi:hypothetical protein
LHIFRRYGPFASCNNTPEAQSKVPVGFGDPAIAADTYTHTSREPEREAALALERYFGEESVPNLFPIGNKKDMAIIQ